MPCISRLPANSSNFIQWYAATTLPIASLASPLTKCSGNGYLPNKIIQYDRNSFPVIIDGEDISFYANLDTPISDSDFGDWVLAVYDTFGNNVDDAVATIVKDEYADSSYRFYVASFSVDSLAEGRYRFVIYNSSTENVKYVSNCFDYYSDSRILDYVYLSYRHSSVLYNFNYTDLTAFRNKIFCKWNNIEDQPEIELNPYSEVTTGEVENSKTYAKEVVTIETDYYDREAQRAMLALSIHDDIKINGNDFTVKEPYQAIPIRGSSIEKGTIRFYNDSVSTINLNGYDV